MLPICSALLKSAALAFLLPLPQSTTRPIALHTTPGALCEVTDPYAVYRQGPIQWGFAPIWSCFQDVPSPPKGMDEVYVLFRGPQTFCGHDLLRYCKHNPVLLAGVVWLRQYAPDFWDNNWWFAIQLRRPGSSPPKEATLSDSPVHLRDGNSTHEDSVLTVRLPVTGFGFSIRTEHDRHFEKRGEVHTREFFVDLPIKGKQTRCRCIEGTADVDVLARDSFRLSFPSEQKTQNDTQDPVRRYPCHITIRLCPDANWYYFKLSCRGKEMGPGWQQVHGVNERGGITGLTRLTDLNEEYELNWIRRREEADYRPLGSVEESRQHEATSRR